MNKAKKKKYYETIAEASRMVLRRAERLVPKISLGFLRTCLGILFLFCSLMLFGCGDDTTVSSIQISPASLTVGINQVQQFSAVGYSAAGKELAITPSWSCSAAVGTISSSGLFTATGIVASGTVVATANGLTSTCPVTVTNKAILTGTIRNPRGVGVANIVVDLKALGLNTTTNASGVYRFTELNAGHVTIETRANTSYLSATGEATLISGETYTKNITINDRFSVLYESFTSVVGGDGVSVTVTITGTVVNNGTSQAEGVSIQYSFTNNVGNNIGVGGPRPIGSLSGGESAPFTVTANLSEAYYNYVRTIGATN